MCTLVSGGGEVLEDEDMILAELVAYWSPLARKPVDEESGPIAERRLNLEARALNCVVATEWPACPSLTPAVCKERLARAPVTSPGVDGLRYNHLCSLHEITGPLSSGLFAEWVADGSWPFCFQDSLVVCLHKDPQHTPSAGDIRPISLLSCASKILTQHLACWMLSVVPALIHASQKGFLPGRGLSSALYELELQVFTSGSGALLLLDIAKAFPTIKQSWLPKALASTGAPRWLIACITSLYSRQS